MTVLKTPYTDKLIDMVNQKWITEHMALAACLSYLGDQGVKSMIAANAGYFEIDFALLQQQVETKNS